MYKIGIDLGGTNIAGGVLDGEKIIKRASAPTPKNCDENMLTDAIASLVEQLISGFDISCFDSIGVGSPGVVDTKAGVISNIVNICSGTVDMCRLLSKKTGFKVYVENDANCAAIGEAKAGASKGSQNSVMVTLGTGVGGGVIIDGKMFSGIKGGGTEIGHMVICADGGIKCKCGRVGCFEQYASATALVRMMDEASKDDEELCAYKPFDGKFIFDQAHNGNKTAIAALEKFKHYLAVGIANIINIFQPEIVVVGGGMSVQGEFLLETVRDEVGKMILTKDSSITKIKAAECGNDAGIIGAAYCMDFK